MEHRSASSSLPFLLALATTLAFPMAARAQVDVSFYGVHMDPAGQDAKDYSRASYGVGIHAGVPIPQVGKVLAGAIGLELINMLSETHQFQDSQTGLTVEQQTSQTYTRLFLGPEIGPHGNGFFRPHVGAHVALVVYDISTDVVIPDDVNRENEIRQNLRSKTRSAFGYDLNAGTDLNFGKWFVEGGARFAKTFNVPQQLGDGAVKVHPSYVQIYLGLGLNFRGGTL